MRNTFIATAVAAATVAGGFALSASASPTDATARAAASVVAADTADTAQPGGVLARRGLGWWFRTLDQTQRDCLAKASLTRPVGPLDAGQRQALRAQMLAAAKTCGITVPSMGDGTGAGPSRPGGRYWARLTDEQRSCLKDAGLTRPLGRLTDAQRQQLRQKVEEAAKSCGVTLPTRPAAGAGSTS